MHLIKYFDDLKEASWLEIDAYQRLTGVEIPPGECRIIINLGREQESMAYKASKKDCIAPFVAELSSESSSSIVSNFFARFKSI